MAIKRLGAQRFSGLAADVNNLPLDADLIGAIFNSTDTLGFWIFNGTSWNESAGGGGITGLEPNSTILEYSTEITDYTTPINATVTTPPESTSDDTQHNHTGLQSTGWQNFADMQLFSGLTVGDKIATVECNIASTATGTVTGWVYDDLAGDVNDLKGTSDSPTAVNGVNVMTFEPPILITATEMWVGF